MDDIEFETVKPEVQRDRWGRPLIQPVGGGKAVGYTRCTTFIDVLEDRSALEKWKMREVLHGIAIDPTIANVARLDTREYRSGTIEVQPWKTRMNALAQEALNAAGTDARATAGTDLHALTEVIDAGKPIPPGLLDDDYLDMEAYIAAKRRVGLIPVATEQFVVNDKLKVAGTLDRIYMVTGEFAHPATGEVVALHNALLVGDVKTGSIHPGKVAMQVHIYASSDAYDLATGSRTPLGVDYGGGILPVRQDLGLLVHLPQGEATCDVYLIDLTLGSHGVSVARDVRAWRNDGKRAINLKAAL